MSAIQIHQAKPIKCFLPFSEVEFLFILTFLHGLVLSTGAPGISLGIKRTTEVPYE